MPIHRPVRRMGSAEVMGPWIRQCPFGGTVQDRIWKCLSTWPCGKSARETTLCHRSVRVDLCGGHAVPVCFKGGLT